MLNNARMTPKINNIVHTSANTRPAFDTYAMAGGFNLYTVWSR